LGVYTELDEVTNLQCDYLETLDKCECLEKELSKKNQSKEFRKEREQYFEIQDLKAQLHDKGIAISELKKPIEKLKGKYVDTKFEKSSVIRQLNAFKSQRPSILGKPTIFSDSLERKDFSKSNLKAKTSNVNFVCATCGKCVLNVKHDMCVLQNLNGVNSRTIMPIDVPLVEIILFIVDSGCSKHMTGNLKLLTNFVEKFLGTVKFGNDQIAPILGYGHLKSTCYICDLKGNDLLTGSSGTDLYSITLQDTSSPNPICLMAKATSSQAWLWHRRLSHLNFDTINFLSKNDIVIGLPKLIFFKDHLCSSCELGKAKQKYTWTHFLRSKDETPEVLIDFLRLVQRGLHAQGFFTKRPLLEHLNKTALSKDGTVQAARTMLSATKVPLFFWAEAIATACFTQNRSLVIPRHEKTPYHIINDRKPSIKFFHIFGSLSYIVRDGENLDKMKEKGDACILQDHVSSDPVPQCQRTALEHVNLSPGPQCQENVPDAAGTVTTSNELDLLFILMFNELLNGSTQVVSKSSAVTTIDAINKCQQQHITPLNSLITPEPTCQVPTQAPTVSSTENINQAETIKENAQVENDEFINIFYTLVQDRGETSSRHVDSSNMPIFYQRHPSEHRWTKDHPLEQVIGNPSQSVRTRCQLELDGEMCMFALTVSRTEPKNIKEAMADSAWIELMQEELH
nr:hypothetical protein [Tanacetum cinerariifolium]